MRTTFSLVLLAALAAASQASIYLNLDNPIIVVNRPITGTTRIAITGSVGTTNSDYRAVAQNVSFPFTYGDGSALQYGGLQPDLNSLYTTGSYTGDLLYLDVLSSTPVGEYKYIGGTNSSLQSQIGFSFAQKDTDRLTSLTGTYSVIVREAVPEPASMIALGAGALALVRRRNRV